MLTLTKDLEAGNINIVLNHCLKSAEADPWLVSCLGQDVEKTDFEFLTASSKKVLNLPTQSLNPSGICFPIVYSSGTAGLVDVKCRLDSRGEHAMPSSLLGHKKCFKRVFQSLEKLFWEKNPLTMFSSANIDTSLSNYRGSFQKEIKGESFSLALGLEIFSICTQQKLPFCIAATGRIDEEGQVLSVDDVEKKVAMILKERPFVKMILVPAEIKISNSKVIPVLNFKGAIKKVFGSLDYSLRKELDNFPPEIFLKHADEHLRKGERASCIVKSKQLVSYTKALDNAHSQTLRLQAMMLLAYAQHNTPEKSFQTYTEALILYEKLKSRGWCNDPVIGLKLYNGAAEPAKDLYQFDKALELAQKSLKMSELIKDLTGNRYNWMAAQAHIAQILISMNETENARPYLTQAMDCAQDLKDEDSILRYHCNELRLEMQAGNIKKAHQLYKQQQLNGVVPHQYLLLEWVRLGYEGAKKGLEWAKESDFKKLMSGWAETQGSEEWLDILKMHFYGAWKCWIGDVEGIVDLVKQDERVKEFVKMTGFISYRIMIKLRLSECYEKHGFKDKAHVEWNNALKKIDQYKPMKKHIAKSKVCINLRDFILNKIFI